jgi:hemolysin activation/secretion protein
MNARVFLAASWLMLSATFSYAADESLSTGQASAAGTDAKPSFDLFDFQIDGNTVLDDETLEKAVYSFLGPNKTVDDVENARKALEDAYRKAGYPTVVVAIPEQDVNEGIVRIEVLEGKIETVHITGAKYYALGKIRDTVPALAEGQVPHMPTVQEQMTILAQQAPDRNVTPIFRAGSTPGQMEVEMRVKDDLPLHGSVEMNSRSSSNTSYSRLIGSVRYDNLWQKYHSASLQYQTSPQDSSQVSVWSGTYVMPTGWFDTRLAMYGIGISSNTLLGGALGTSIGGESVVGAGSIYGVRVVKPLTTSTGVIQNLTAGFDYKSFDQTLSIGGKETTAIQYASFMSGYDGNWRKEGSITTLNVANHFAFRGVGTNPAQFQNKRAGATDDFMYFTGDLRHQHVLPFDFRLQTRTQGQVSMTPLISNEQFMAGGPLSVRGYHQTQVLADHGINLSVELHTPRLAPDSWDEVQNLRLLTFFDWANLWTMAPIAPTSPISHLASTGVGLRSLWFKHLLGELDWSYPLYQQNNVGVGEQRVDFRMLYDF